GDRTLWQNAPFHTVAPALRRVADVAFAGDGEPTAARTFGESVAAVKAVRDRHGVDVPIRLLTNATLLHRERVRAALAGVDEVWCKLDAGTAEYFRVVDGTTFPFERILANLASLARERPIVIQSMFLTVDGAGPSEAELDAWTWRIGDLLAGGGAVSLVQVYTVARKPSDARVGPLDAAALEGIAERVRVLGIPVEVHA
ncbi:MAG: radical SAM protein, partial [Myxococcota bacterium]